MRCGAEYSDKGSHLTASTSGSVLRCFYYTYFRFVALSWLAWRRHQMGTFLALLAICSGNSPVPGEFPAQRPVTRSFDVFFNLGLNKRLSKQSWGSWFETLSRPLWRHCNVDVFFYLLLALTHKSICWCFETPWRSHDISFCTCLRKWALSIDKEMI